MEKEKKFFIRIGDNVEQVTEEIYYIEEKDVIFIASYNNNAVELYDILSENKISFREIKDYILKDATNHVRFHFTPDWLNINYDVIPCNNNALYVYGDYLPVSASV